MIWFEIKTTVQLDISTHMRLSVWYEEPLTSLTLNLVGECCCWYYTGRLRQLNNQSGLQPFRPIRQFQSDNSRRHRIKNQVRGVEIGLFKWHVRFLECDHNRHVVNIFFLQHLPIFQSIVLCLEIIQDWEHIIQRQNLLYSIQVNTWLPKCKKLLFVPNASHLNGLFTHFV